MTSDMTGSTDPGWPFHQAERIIFSKSATYTRCAGGLAGFFIFSLLVGITSSPEDLSGGIRIVAGIVIGCALLIEVYLAFRPRWQLTSRALYVRTTLGRRVIPLYEIINVYYIEHEIIKPGQSSMTFYTIWVCMRNGKSVHLSVLDADETKIVEQITAAARASDSCCGPGN